MKTKYTLEEEIIHFVFLAFYGLKRNKEDVDLSFHSIMVGIMLKNIGCSEDIVYSEVKNINFTFEEFYQNNKNNPMVDKEIVYL